MQRINDAVTGWWYSKTFEERKKFTKWTILGIAFIGYVVITYVLQNSTEEAKKANDAPVSTEVVILDTPNDVLEKDILALAESRISEKVESAKSSFEQQLSALPEISSVEEVNAAPSQHIQLDPRFPVPPSGQPSVFDYGNQEIVETEQEQQVDKPQENWTKIGGLRSGKATKDDYKAASIKADKSHSEARKVTLPVGFMKARLLVGINARSGEFGMSNPQQLVFLVQAPAQLPNKIKMDLAGCFAVTNAFGDISSGRIEAPPVSLTCLTHKGKYIAEAKDLKGFVQDQDGKRGLDARVVSRARHLLAASLFARTIEAFGSLGVADSMVTSNSALGSVSTVDSSKLLQNGAAKGLEGGFSDLSQYLLDLAKNTQPVMEHGAGKSVLMWLAETTELEIKEMKQ